MADDSCEPLRQLQSPFLSLPLELVIEIIGHLSSHPRDLCSLAITCRLVQPICENVLYSTIELRDTDELKAICDAFAGQQRRVRAVHALKLVYKYRGGLAKTVEDRNRFNRCIKHMSNLRDWHIESPFDNNNWADEGSAEWVERDMQIFRQALELSCLHQGQPRLEDVGLAKLQKLTIHSHGIRTDFWELGRYECLFRHPTLRYLHLSCVRFPPDLPGLEPFACTTPLTTLTFDECELEPSSLKSILKTPKSLKNLTLGENVHNTQRSRDYVPRLTPAPEAALQALMPVAHSLEALTHFDPTFGTLPDPAHPPSIHLKGYGMRDFHCLKYLECDTCSFLHQGIVVRHALAPPNLERLRLRRYSRQQEDFFDQLPNPLPYTYLSGLKELEFVQPMFIARYGEHRRLAEYICHAGRLRDRHAFAYQMWKCGINTKVYAEMQRKWSYIPPYLYGERLPEPIVVYDAAKIGFMRVSKEDIPDVDASPTLHATWTASLSGAFATAPSPLRLSTSESSFYQDQPKETDYLSRHDILQIQNQVDWSLGTYCKSQGLLPESGMMAYIVGGAEWDSDEDYLVQHPMVGFLVAGESDSETESSDGTSEGEDAIEGNGDTISEDAESSDESEEDGEDSEEDREDGDDIDMGHDDYIDADDEADLIDLD